MEKITRLDGAQAVEISGPQLSLYRAGSGGDGGRRKEAHLQVVFRHLELLSSNNLSTMQLLLLAPL